VSALGFFNFFNLFYNFLEKIKIVSQMLIVSQISTLNGENGTQHHTRKQHIHFWIFEQFGHVS